MEDPARTLITLGGLFLAGLVTDLIGRHTPLPRVTLLLILGFAIGPAGLDLLPRDAARWFPIVADMALVMVGFLLGGTLTRATLRRHGRDVLWLSLSEVMLTAAAVLAGLLLVGARLEVALLLAAIATATAPAATTDVVREVRAQGPFSETLQGIVAVDDAWGLVIFSLFFAVAHSLDGGTGSLGILAQGAWEVGGSVLVGVALGLPLAQLSGRIRPGEPTLVEALGAVFLCGGIALWLEVSYLLAAMVMGALVANLARHHVRPFHAIEGIEWPFMILFFVLSGASLHRDSLAGVGTVALAFIGFRILGRIAGAWALVGLGRIERRLGAWMGLALLPQAGVALGMALVATQRMPQLGREILPVVIGATVFFELVGPVLTRLALLRAGEARVAGED